MMILLLNGVTAVSIWEDISKVTSVGLYCENETSEADERNQRWCGVGRGDGEVRGAGVGVEGWQQDVHSSEELLGTGFLASSLLTAKVKWSCSRTFASR